MLHILTIFFFLTRLPPKSPLFPYTTLFRSVRPGPGPVGARPAGLRPVLQGQADHHDELRLRSEEHTSELQSQSNLVCRLMLEKKKVRLIVGTCVAPTSMSLSEAVNHVNEAS